MALTGDERILGDSVFVERALDRNQEAFERKYALRAKGIDLDHMARHVAQLFEMSPEALWQPGKYRQLVQARSVLCYWAVRELGETMTAMGERLKISTAAVSKAARRGDKIIDEQGFDLRKLIS